MEHDGFSLDDKRQRGSRKRYSRHSDTTLILVKATVVASVLSQDVANRKYAATSSGLLEPRSAFFPVFAKAQTFRPQPQGRHTARAAHSTLGLGHVQPAVSVRVFSFPLAPVSNGAHDSRRPRVSRAPRHR